MAPATLAVRDRLLPSVRWGLTAALAYLVLFDQPGDPGAGEILFVGVVLASNFVTSRLDRWFSRTRSFLVLLGVDSALILLGLLLADSASQDLVIGYFLCVLFAAFADSEERLVGLSLLAAGLYAFVELRQEELFLRTAVLLRLPLLVFVTLSYGLLVTRLRSEEAAREAAERRAVGLQTLLRLTRALASTLSTAEILERMRGAVEGALAAKGSRVVRLTDHDDAASNLAIESLVQRRPLVRTAGADGKLVLALPLFQGTEAFGTIVADLDRAGGALSSNEHEFCEIAMDAAALALGNAHRYEELVRTEQTKSEFLGNLSHEMHTPLHAILGFTDIAARAIDEGDPGAVREALDRVRTRAEEMSVHVEDLLGLSRLTLGRERLAPEAVDLKEILARSVEDARHVAGSRDFDLTVPAEVEHVIVDGEKLARILDCLLLNAVKFGERGRIVVHAALDNGKLLRLSVRDEGVGISNELGARIFDDFRQGDGSASRRFPGLGLGLSVSRRLAELLGGEIHVASAPGEGSTFEVVLPVSVPHAA